MTQWYLQVLGLLVLWLDWGSHWITVRVHLLEASDWPKSWIWKISGVHVEVVAVQQLIATNIYVSLQSKSETPWGGNRNSQRRKPTWFRIWSSDLAKHESYLGVAMYLGTSSYQDFGVPSWHRSARSPISRRWKLSASTAGIAIRDFWVNPTIRMLVIGKESSGSQNLSVEGNTSVEVTWNESIFLMYFWSF